MENVPASGGLGANSIRSTLHGGNSPADCYCGGKGLGQSYTFPGYEQNGDKQGGSSVTSFHTYGAIWSPNMLQFYVDDPSNVFLVRTIDDVPAGLGWDFNHPFFLLLNLAVGGTKSWPGPPKANTPSPAIMMVDYVRWYKPSPVAGPAMTALPIAIKRGSEGNSKFNLNSIAGTGRVYLSCITMAPHTACSINSGDPMNQDTVDFSKSSHATATVRLTTANLERAPGAETIGRATPSRYIVTVNAYTVSNTNGIPDSMMSIPLKID